MMSDILADIDELTAQSDLARAQAYGLERIPETPTEVVDLLFGGDPLTPGDHFGLIPGLQCDCPTVDRPIYGAEVSYWNDFCDEIVFYTSLTECHFYSMKICLPVFCADVGSSNIIGERTYDEI